MPARWLAALLAVWLAGAPPAGVSAGAAPPAAGAAAGTAPPGVGAGAVVLMDVESGRILHSRNGDRQLAPASTTKILTAVLVLERLPDGVALTVSRRAADTRMGATAGLRAGERWPARDLLALLLVHSANDAAVALAEGVAGSVERFTAAMNARARELGARGSRFANPHGLDAPSHHTTALDLARIARHALTLPRFDALVRLRAWTLVRPGQAPTEYTSRNRLLGRYPGADGVKTGQTAAAGQALVASATRDGWRLLAVVLRSQEMFEDAERLLDHGFSNFRPVVVARAGQVMATVTVGGRGLDAVVPADVRAVVRRGAAVVHRVTVRGDLRAPVAAGTQIGEVRFLEGETVVARSVLVAAREVGP